MHMIPNPHLEKKTIQSSRASDARILGRAHHGKAHDAQTQEANLELRFVFTRCCHYGGCSAGPVFIY